MNKALQATLVIRQFSKDFIKNPKIFNRISLGFIFCIILAYL